MGLVAARDVVVGYFILGDLLHTLCYTFIGSRFELPFENKFVGNSKKRIQVKRTLVKAWVQFIEESYIYLLVISYLATTELRP